MRLFIGILGLFIWSAGLGQYKGPKFPIKDEWFWKYGAKGLQVGDKMPDISFGAVINNKTGKTRFSQFKGKLVILDFWSTGCTSCMAKFPEMEHLQKEFEDQIQIVLVNPWETEQQIKERMEHMERFKDFKFPNLPAIVSNRPYANLNEYFKNPSLIGKCFPALGVPHHVWIDKDGIIRLRGGAENTYAAKIRDFLSGKSIEFLKNNSTVPDLKNDRNARYYQQLGWLKNTPVKYGSFITPYNNEITGSYGTPFREIIDSVSGIRITSVINQDLLQLYLTCFNRERPILGGDSKLVFSPSAYMVLDFIEFPNGLDTLDFTSDPSIIHRNLTTEEITRSKYCYEQVVPLAVPDAERYKMVLEDLNRYFKVHYGIIGSVQNKLAKYYDLIRISKDDKIGTDSSGKMAKVVRKGDQSILQFQGSLIDLFPEFLRNKNAVPVNFLYDSDGHPFLVCNGTGWPGNKKVALNIPMEGLQSFSNLRRMLQMYDLDLVERSGFLPFYVFSRINSDK